MIPDPTSGRLLRAYAVAAWAACALLSCHQPSSAGAAPAAQIVELGGARGAAERAPGAGDRVVAEDAPALPSPAR